MIWILDNKEWLFSGLLVALPLAVIGWIISRRGKNQVQKGGKNSRNIQIGGNLTIGDKKDHG